MKKNTNKPYLKNEDVMFIIMLNASQILIKQCFDGHIIIVCVQ